MNFLKLKNINNYFITPGRKRLISNVQKKEINWDFNQDFDMSDNQVNFSIEGARVFHQKYGYGTLLIMMVKKRM